MSCFYSKMNAQIVLATSFKHLTMCPLCYNMCTLHYNMWRFLVLVLSVWCLFGVHYNWSNEKTCTVNRYRNLDVPIYLCGFSVFTHFINAWYEICIVISCKHTQCGLWNACMQVWENSRHTNTTQHGWFCYSWVTHKLWLFAQKENASTMHVCVNLKVSYTITVSMKGYVYVAITHAWVLYFTLM